jgi:hypothetical protein
LQVTTAQATSITETTAATGGIISLTGEESVTQRGVCWDTKNNPAINGLHIIDGSGTGSFVSFISGLTGNTIYYARAFATTSAGLTTYGNEIVFTTPPSGNTPKSQIIADHSVIADSEKIPLYYINEVKKMMISWLGESHSYAYERGLELLALEYPALKCNIGTREAYTDQYLRIDNGPDTGEGRWFTWFAYPTGSMPAESYTVKNRIKDFADQGYPISVLGFGWCWDMVASNTSTETDPVYGCHWFGATNGGPEGSLSFGLNESDTPITGNSVSMDTYLGATKDYIEYCNANNYLTRIVYTTGPVDDRKERSYQAFIKHEYIRNFVRQDTSRILMDYADILCYDDDGRMSSSSWNGHQYPVLTSSNLGDGSIGHIGYKGVIRLAKAQWWMLARIAGWDGN